MGAILNGLALSKMRPFGSSFLIFSDYCAAGDPAERADGNPGHLHLHARFDRRRRRGPTHQPVEQLASLRAMPGLITLRPRDANEVVEAWRVIMQLQHRAGRADPDAAGAADARSHQVRAGRRRARKALTCWPTRRTASPT